MDLGADVPISGNVGARINVVGFNGGVKGGLCGGVGWMGARGRIRSSELGEMSVCPMWPGHCPPRWLDCPPPSRRMVRHPRAGDGAVPDLPELSVLPLPRPPLLAPGGVDLGLSAVS